MTRGLTLVLAIGLVILWMLGLSYRAAAWMTWLDALAALSAFAIVAAMGPGLARGAGDGGLAAIGLGLGIVWIIGLARHTELWLTWWTFAFAVAFVAVAIGDSLGSRQPRSTAPRLA